MDVISISRTSRKHSITVLFCRMVIAVNKNRYGALTINGMPSQAEVRGVMRRIVMVHFQRRVELWAASWVFLGLACCGERGIACKKVVSRPEVRAVVDLLSTQKVSIHRPIVELAPVDGLCQVSMSSDDARSAHHSKGKRDAIGCDMRSVLGHSRVEWWWSSSTSG